MPVEVRNAGTQAILSEHSNLVIVVRRYQKTCFEKHSFTTSLPFVSHLSVAAWNAIDHPLIANSVLFLFFYSFILHN